jgi:ectoine hydroxylase-related dioxygenase (phytanoyl-CoA dioxygenase family)
MGVWAALEDIDEDNGPLVAVKGSHKLGEPDLSKLKSRFHPNEPVPPSSPELFNAYNEELISLANKAGLETVVCKVNKGDVIVWNPATLHGGLPHVNKEKTRRSFVMHVTPKNTPMKHMDYFFNPTKTIEPINKDYENYSGRLLEVGDKIDFMHKKVMSVDFLGRFENKGVKI